MFSSQLRVRERAIAQREAAVAHREVQATGDEIVAKSAALDASQKQIDQKLAAWTTVINMATHFNEICLNVRRFALATLATLLAATGVAYRFGGNINLHHPDAAGYIVFAVFTVYAVPIFLGLFVWSRPKPNSGRYYSVIGTLIAAYLWGIYHVFVRSIPTIHVASLFVAVAAVVWILCFLMDRFWYHELLRGATKECMKLEESLSAAGLALSVTFELRKFSHASLNRSAGFKLSVFYLSIYAILIGTLTAILLVPQSVFESPGETLGGRSTFEIYPLEPLPAFQQGSAELSDQAREAICASRAALAAMQATNVIVVAGHDHVELGPELRRTLSSNASLARHRAERVADALGGAIPCGSPAVAQVLALNTAPFHVGRSVEPSTLEKDRRVVIYALRIVSPLVALPSGGSR